MNFARVVFAFVSLAASSFARAGEPSDTFERGVTAYQSAAYGTAREHWLAALSEADADRASTLYNLGNLAFREKRPLEAAGWYTASLRVEPRSSDAWHNLEFARREAGLEPADRGDLRATAKRLAASLTLLEAERLVLAIAVVLALAFAWEALRGGRLAKWACGVCAGLLVLALIPWTWQLAHQGGDPLFVIQPEGATLFSEPRDAAPVIGRLSPATEAERVDAIPGWVRVRGSEGAVGWIAEETCLALTSAGRSSSLSKEAQAAASSR